MILSKDYRARWLPIVDIDQWRAMSTARGSSNTKKPLACAGGFLCDRRDAITPACTETPTKELFNMVPILTRSHEAESWGFTWDFSRLLVARARFNRCPLTRAIACASVSGGKGKTAVHTSRPGAVESAGTTATSSGCARSGSRADVGSHAPVVGATHHNAAAVRATWGCHARSFCAWNSSPPLSVFASWKGRSLKERRQLPVIQRAGGVSAGPLRRVYEPAPAPSPRRTKPSARGGWPAATGGAVPAGAASWARRRGARADTPAGPLALAPPTARAPPPRRPDLGGPAHRRHHRPAARTAGPGPCPACPSSTPAPAWSRPGGPAAGPTPGVARPTPRQPTPPAGTARHPPSATRRQGRRAGRYPVARRRCWAGPPAQPRSPPAAAGPPGPRPRSLGSRLASARTLGGPTRGSGTYRAAGPGQHRR